MSDSDLIDHVARPALPWRDDRLTECGRPVTDVAAWLTRDQFVAKVKAQGKQRSALTSCMTCWETASRWSNWEQNPADVLRREVRYGSHDEARVNAELRAIAALIAEHREEFDGYLAGLAGAADLAARRTARLRRGVR